MADAASAPRYPALYQVNTRVLVTDLAVGLGRPATLDDIPDDLLATIAARGFDWVWLLSVWEVSAASRAFSRSDPGLRRDLLGTLPDLRDADIGGSGFAIAAYDVAAALGGDAALARLRDRLRGHGLRLMLDFVPNHTGLDHPWVDAHPEYYIEGSERDLLEAPANWTWVRRPAGDRLLAHGRDPYFPGWADTLQLDYANPATQDAMSEELRRVARRCDGVRCDMAMLLLPDVFERTWGRLAPPFWPRAIAAVREEIPGFLFMAEVYWDLEWTMQQLGFDAAYDKRLYDRLRDGAAGPVRDHLRAGVDYQDHLARFLENHDEPRAAATFPPGHHEAAAVVAYLTPGLRFFQHGQLDGHRVHVSPHLVRAPEESPDPAIAAFYERLLAVLRHPAVRDGAWQLLSAARTWDGDVSADAFIAWAWAGADAERLLVAVNLAPDTGRCFVRLPWADLGGRSWCLRDELGEARYVRDGDDLAARGLFLEIPGLARHAFTLTPA